MSVTTRTRPSIEKNPSRKSRRKRTRGEDMTMDITSKSQSRSKSKTRSQSQSRSRLQDTKRTKVERSKSKLPLSSRPTKISTQNQSGKKCRNSNINIISSFASTFIREYVKKTPNHVYGELDDDNGKCFLYNTNGKEKKMTKQAIYKELKKKKKTHYFIIKVMANAPVWYYPAHWYFQTPFSPDDTSKMMEESDTLWKGRTPEKEPIRTLNNSYAMRWQVNRSNQFCMLYALYGLMSKNLDVHPFKTVKLLKDSDIESRHNTVYNRDPNQNQNTSNLLSFFTFILQEYTDLFDSSFDTPPLLKIEDLFVIQRSVIEAKHAKYIKHHHQRLDEIDADESMNTSMKENAKEELHANLQQKQEENHILKTLTKQDIIDELENGVHCPVKYGPQF